MGKLWRAFCNDRHQDWPKYIAEITIILNYSVSESLGISPAALMLNIDTAVPIFQHLKISTQETLTAEDGIDWNNKLIMADLRRKEVIRKRNSKARQKEKSKQIVQEGDLVFLKQYNVSSLIDHKIKKWLLLYRGPFICVRKVKENVVELVDPTTNQSIGLQSVARCKLWHPTESTRKLWTNLVQKHIPKKTPDGMVEQTVVSKNVSAQVQNIVIHYVNREQDEKLSWNDVTEEGAICNVALRKFLDSTKDQNVENLVVHGYLDPINAKVMFGYFIQPF
jgi:hypothetical protein